MLSRLAPYVQDNPFAISERRFLCCHSVTGISILCRTDHMYIDEYQ